MRAKTLRNPMSLMNQLLDPRFIASVEKGNANVYEVKTGERERERDSDQIRRCIYLNTTSTFAHATTFDAEPTEIGDGRRNGR